MINGIQYIEGYAKDLPCIKDTIFKFEPGINVLFGPNGCGKSTILKTIKGYCGISKGGWSRVSDPGVLGTNGWNPKYKRSLNFPHLYCRYTPGNCLAHVGWDGTPSFFNDGDIKISETFFFQNVGNHADDGITTEAEQLEILAEKPSSGQYRSRQLNKIFNLLKDPPDCDKVDSNIKRKFDADREKQYWKKLPNIGPRTILLDEPERSLSLPFQEKVLCELLPKEMGNYQVIIATHSVFALKIPGANIIDMDPGYIDNCKQLLGW